MIDSVRESLVVLGWDLRVHFANQSFYKRFAVTREETEGHLIYELGNGQWDIPELRLLLEEILPRENSFDDYKWNISSSRLASGPCCSTPAASIT